MDWCEDNYTVTGNIAEFTNTLSNILLVVIPAVALKYKLWGNYSKFVTKGVEYVLYLFVFVGISSAYFHATLSLLGQWLDEMGILWAVCFSYAFFTPSTQRPKFVSETMTRVLASFLAITLTVTWFIAPYVNAFWLMCLGVPCFIMLRVGLKKEKDQSVVKIIRVTCYLAVSSVTLWISDRAMCNFWLNLGIPGLHNVWHLLSTEVAYCTLTIFAYWKAVYDKPYLKVSMKCMWGIPYVHCKDRMSS